MTETTLKPGMKTQSAWTSRAWTATVLLGLALMVSCSCNDGPVQPVDVHYNVYVAALAWPNGNATDPLFIIDADSMVVIDSIPRIGSLHDMEVSPDGRWLYTFVHRGSVSGCPNDSLRRIDIKNKVVDWAIPSGLNTRIELLEGGDIILRSWARYSSCPAGEELLDAVTGQVLRELPDTLRYLEGPVAGTEVAATLGDSLGAPIVAVDVQTDVTRGYLVPQLPSGQKLIPAFARLHPDGETVLAVAGLTTNLAWAMIGKLTTGEWLLIERIYDVFSVGAISSDGSLAVVSDMNSGLSVFDVDSLIYRGRIAIPGGQVAFVGDMKSAIMCGRGDYFHATDPVVRVDASALEPTHAVELPLPDPLLGAMAVGRRP